MIRYLTRIRLRAQRRATLSGPDHWGTEDLRFSVLRSWRDSPTRFTEDANTEDDLRLGGYADRLFVELAQNAADAGMIGGKPARVKVSIVDDELRVANTGSPLDRSGVAALASLRASAKCAAGTVGRFGVGFAAVLAVTEAPRLVSTSGGVVFSAERTRAAVAELPQLADQLADRADNVPVLRLPWPVSAWEPPVPAGFDTEVRLPLRSGIDGELLLADLANDAESLLLALPWLGSLESPNETWTRAPVSADVVELTGPHGSRRWMTHAFSGTFRKQEVESLGVDAGRRDHWNGLWAVQIDHDDAPLPHDEGVLYIPTPTDERLSLPARLIATVPAEPTRRRVRWTDATHSVLTAAADAYPQLLLKLAPSARLGLVPRCGFPLSEVDSTLAESISDRLAETAWLPAAGGGAELAPREARVLRASLPLLITRVSDAVSDLADASLCGPSPARVLGTLGGRSLTVGELVDEITGIEREPAWWACLYEALFAGMETGEVVRDDLGGLPVPLLNGRTVPGPRTVLVPDDNDTELVTLLAGLDVPGLHVVHPDAVHPLLGRIGAITAGAGELLSAKPVQDAVQRSVDDAEAGLDTAQLVSTVLSLVRRFGRHDGLGGLALPAQSGQWRRADELLLPTSPLLRIFDRDAIGADGPLEVIDEAFAAKWSVEPLTAIGVLDTFAVLSDLDPAEAEDALADGREWLAGLSREPDAVLGVRDLDLVADEAWPDALRLLADNESTWRALVAPNGYTGWWIARHALLGGQRPTHWRLPEADDLFGLYDPVPRQELSIELLEAAGVRSQLTICGAGDVADLLGRLGDQHRTIENGLILRAHAALVNAQVSVSDMPAPRRVRSCAGSVVEADDAVVLDAPWLLPIWQAGRLVAIADVSLGERLADVLDIGLASEQTAATVCSSGEYKRWDELSAVRVVAELHGWSVPNDGVIVHEELVVRVDQTDQVVPWWFDDRLHASNTVGGLGRALAWAMDLWDERHRIIAVLDEPTVATLLG